MMKFRPLMILLLTLLIVAAVGCSGEAETAPESSVAQVETATPVPTVATGIDSAARPTAEVEAEVATVTAPNVEEVIETGQPTETENERIDPEGEVETNQKPAPELITPAIEEAVPFTATTGLDTFTSYRMTFSLDLDGTRHGQATTGTLKGIVETTKEPEAQHWQIEMEGNAFRELALLGALEMVAIDNTIYVQNPQDGSWLGLPAFLVEGMLPADMYTPEDNIELPLTAVLQPGEEVVNGVVTRRYTFGPEDLGSDTSKYDKIEGTIWVAVDGNYVARYEAVLQGQHEGLAAGGMDLLDAGTITTTYDVSDVNHSFTIEAPEGAQDIDLSRFLFQ